MADRLFLSLWFPNFQLTSLPRALVSVLKQFPSPRVYAASVYPIAWNESPTYQRIYDEDEVEESTPEAAVAEATDILHDDFAYEFELKWELWLKEEAAGLDPIWRKQPHPVHVSGFGPLFDEGSYEQNGHVRLDFGIDTLFLLDDDELDSSGAEHVKANIQQLVALTDAIQKHCGISSRLLWTESGENLAEKLIAQLQRVN